MILFLITRCLHAKWRQHSKTSLGGVQYEVTVGIPNFLTPPFDFGISTLLTGWGLYSLLLI